MRGDLCHELFPELLGRNHLYRREKHEAVEDRKKGGGRRKGKRGLGGKGKVNPASLGGIKTEDRQRVRHQDQLNASLSRGIEAAGVERKKRDNPARYTQNRLRKPWIGRL